MKVRCAVELLDFLFRGKEVQLGASILFNKVNVHRAWSSAILLTQVYKCVCSGFRNRSIELYSSIQQLVCRLHREGERSPQSASQWSNHSRPEGGACQRCLALMLWNGVLLGHARGIRLFFFYCSSVNHSGDMDVSVNSYCTVLDKRSQSKFLCYTRRKDGMLSVWWVRCCYYPEFIWNLNLFYSEKYVCAWT